MIASMAEMAPLGKQEASNAMFLDRSPQWSSLLGMTDACETVPHRS